MPVICQTESPHALRDARALPGIAPLSQDDWLCVDEAYKAQMAHRCALLAEQTSDVVAQCSNTQNAIDEVFQGVLAALTQNPSYKRDDTLMLCPDGRKVSLSADPLVTLGQLIQEDICILQKPNGSEEHILTAANLCFPASWTLREKIGKPLIAIHRPVEEYDSQLARRVQRLFDGVQVGRPLWRFNQLWYQDAELHQPRSEAAPRDEIGSAEGDFLRMEKQSIVRMPKTQVVVFSIHTFVMRRIDVPHDIIASMMK